MTKHTYDIIKAVLGPSATESQIFAVAEELARLHIRDPLPRVIKEIFKEQLMEKN